MNAFEGCKNLKEIEFPNSLKKIDAHAFENCSSLKEIKIPDSVEIIEYKAFANCTSLEKALLPNSELTTLENCVFLKCSSLSEVIIPDKLINFNASSFKKCKNLENWSINSTNPNFIKYNDAIYTNDYKKLVFYPETAEKFEIHPDTEIIGEFAFSYNYKLENIVIPDAQTTVNKKDVLMAVVKVESLKKIKEKFNSLATRFDGKVKRSRLTDCYSDIRKALDESVSEFGESALPFYIPNEYSHITILSSNISVPAVFENVSFVY
jgi:hypothetical protein